LYYNLARMRQKALILFVLLSSVAGAQNIDFTKESSLGNLFIRMYGEVHYTQSLGNGVQNKGQFDAKRIVALFGYQFDRNTQFLTEWELEHANEIFLEQAFIKHRIKSNLSLKAGMLLIPMGLVNENHEPNNFFSVDRPFIDKVIVPTTWRDIGAGITGILPGSGLRYQAYLVNGLISYKDGNAKFAGSNTYRSGRQKGSKSLLSGLPALSAQLEYFGLSNTKIGLSIYSGESNTDAYGDLVSLDEQAIARADSTKVFTNMLGFHFSRNTEKWTVRTQVIYAHNSGVDAYNTRTGADLGRSSLGMYVEVGRPFTKNDKWRIFSRFSYLDTDLTSTELVNEKNKGLNHILTSGFNYMAAQGAVFKLEGQWTQLLNSPDFSINAGIGVWF